MSKHFLKPTAMEQLLNRLFGAIVKLGGGLAHNHVLGVRGRKTGQLYETPVNLMAFEGAEYLVAPRGHTGWVKNVAVQPEVTLRRGKTTVRCKLTPVTESERAPLLREYLDRYHPTVKGYFSVQRGAPLEAFAAVAGDHPVFRVERLPG